MEAAGQVHAEEHPGAIVVVGNACIGLSWARSLPEGLQGTFEEDGTAAVSPSDDPQ